MDRETYEEVMKVKAWNDARDAKSKTVSIRVTPAMNERIEELARAERRTKSNMLLIILERGLDRMTR